MEALAEEEYFKHVYWVILCNIEGLRAFGDKKAATNDIKVAENIFDMYRVDYFEVK